MVGGAWSTARRDVAAPSTTTIAATDTGRAGGSTADATVAAATAATAASTTIPELSSAVEATRPRVPTAVIAPEPRRRRRRTDKEKMPGGCPRDVNVAMEGFALCAARVRAEAVCLVVLCA